jgi:hypothetical protein
MDNKKTPTKPAANAAPAPAAAPAATATPAPGGARKTNGLAVAALVLVLLGLFIPGLGLVGIILAIVALVQLKKTGEGGKGLAIAALVIAIAEIIIGTIILFAVIFAVQKAAKDAGVNVNQNGSVNVQGKNGESLSIGNAKLPDGFPSDVPVYKPSDAILSLKTKDGYNVTLATADSAQQVLDFYKNELAKNGWAAEDGSQFVFGANSAQVFSKGSNQLVVLVGTDDNAKNGKKTTINLTVGPKTASDSGQ